MRFLLDVNVGTTIASYLTELGHDVVRVVLSTPRAGDPDILAWAVAEQRILISYDSDFTDLIFRDGAVPPPSAIYLRFEPADLNELLARIADILDEGRLSNHIVVIGPVSTRWRAFPRR